MKPYDNRGAKGSVSNKNYSLADLEEAKKATRFLQKNNDVKSINTGIGSTNSNNYRKPFKPNFENESNSKATENFVIEQKQSKIAQSVQNNRLNFMQKYGGNSGLNPQQNKVDPFGTSGKQTKDSFPTSQGNMYENNFNQNSKTSNTNFNSRPKQQVSYQNPKQQQNSNYYQNNYNSEKTQLVEDNRPIKQLTQ